MAPHPGDLDPIETAPFAKLRALQLERLQWSVRHSIEVSVAVDVVDVASIERSVGKMRRIVDHRPPR